VMICPPVELHDSVMRLLRDLGFRIKLHYSYFIA
jgi:hypothetical protein